MKYSKRVVTAGMQGIAINDRFQSTQCIYMSSARKILRFKNHSTLWFMTFALLSFSLFHTPENQTLLHQSELTWWAKYYPTKIVLIQGLSCIDSNEFGCSPNDSVSWRNDYSEYIVQNYRPLDIVTNQNINRANSNDFRNLYTLKNPDLAYWHCITSRHVRHYLTRVLHGKINQTLLFFRLPDWGKMQENI